MMRALRRRKRSRSRGRKGVVRPLEKTVSFLRYAEGAEGEGSVLEQGRGSLLEQRGGFDQMGREGGRIIVERALGLGMGREGRGSQHSPSLNAPSSTGFGGGVWA